MQFKQNIKLNQMPLNESQLNIQNDILKIIKNHKFSDVEKVLKTLRKNLKHNSTIN